jgi:adenylate cyclase
MTTEDFKRKLTAVFSADVVGYSRLMGEDEAATVKTLEIYKGVMFSLIKQHRGRVVDSPGDNLLAEFGSVVDAVQCAVAVQKELQARNSDLPENRRMQFRVGINLGDVIEEKERIYGDGVNIAARLEALAEPGGICVSKTAFDQIESKLPLGYQFLGEQTVKNIAKPVGAYKVLLEPRVIDVDEKEEAKKIPFWRRKAVMSVGILVLLIIVGLGAWNFYFRAPPLEPASKERMAYPLPDKPSIAILPFANMSGDPAQEYIGDGLSENIIGTLSKISKMFVVARNSTFSYKGKPVRVQQVAEELGVQYVLEGSVQKSGEKLRVTAQLIDALSGHHMWSEKYDRKMKDLFDLQDEITKKIVVSLQVELTPGDQALIFARSTTDLDAWGNMVKGYSIYYKFRREDNLKARELFESAIKIDPAYVPAWAFLASTHLLEVVFRWSESPADSFKRAHEIAEKAVALDDNNAVAHSMLGFIYLFQRKHEKAISEGRRAISLDPNDSGAYGRLGQTMFYSGQLEEAIELLKKSMRLNPYFPPVNLSFLSRSYLLLGRYEEAIEPAKQLVERCRKGECPPFMGLPQLAQAYTELGRDEESKYFAAKWHEIKPRHFSEFQKRLPWKNPAQLQRIREMFAKAGLQDREPLPLPDKPSIAVLPFVNMSGDPEQEYFSDGITEELINTLAKLEGLKVISRTSAFHFKGKDVALRIIGEKLKVENVLEGSVRKAGNKLRISAQLIRVADDSHLWADTYNRELKDIFSIQEEVSRAIVEKLRVALLDKKDGKLVKRYTENIEAYELYVKGRFLSNKIPFKKAIAYFEQALALDPNYALPYTGLADAYKMMAFFFSGSLEEYYLKAKAAGLKALEIDDTLSEAHASLGDLKLRFEWDWKGAERALKRAIELDTGYALAHENYAKYLWAMGRLDEGIAEIKIALELDPLSVMTNVIFGHLLNSAHKVEQAMKQYQKALDLYPKNPIAMAFLGDTYVQNGKYEDGITLLEKAVSITRGKNPFILGKLGYLYGVVGKREKAQEILDEVLQRSKKGYLSPMMVGSIYTGLGDKEKAFEWLEKAYEERDPRAYPIKTVASYRSLHSDPRFTALLKKMGLEG